MTDELCKANASWPYANPDLLHARKLDIITHQATAVLCKALASGRILCFVGSGVSNCYGRLGWTEMVEFLTNCALREAEAKEYRGDSLVASLATTLKAIAHGGQKQEPTPVKMPHADRLIDTADLAIKLHDRLEQLSNGMHPSGRQLIKVDMLDDSGHMRHLLDTLSPNVSPVEGRGKIRSLAQARKEREKLRRVFTSGRLRAALDEWGRLGGSGDLLDRILEIADDPDAADTGGRDRPLPVKHRHLLTLVWALGAKSTDRTVRGLRALKIGRPRRSTLLSRADYVGKSRDPLEILYNELGVRRFLTTNFDEEIERLFRDKGFALRGDPTAEQAHDGRLVGSREASVLVYEQEQASRLVAFASQDKLGGPGVVYLHGRATPNDHMVVTSEDYRKLYLRHTPWTTLSQSALRLTFAGNPVVFVGLGMAEGDVLRPLREFMASSETLESRPVVAILPATGSSSDVSAQASRLLDDFGVLSIFYGGRPGADTNGEPWLSRLHDGVRALDAALTAAKKPEPFPEFEAPSSIDGIRIEGTAFDVTEECGLLNGISAYVRSCMDRGGIPEHAKEALRTSLTELKFGIQGTLLCATLRSLAAARDRWHDDWTYTGRAREPRPSTVGENGAVAFSFGSIFLPTAKQEKYGLRFFADAPSQSFNTLLRALRQGAENGHKTTGRRVLLLVGARGVGRGHFFSALQHSDRLKALCRTFTGNESWKAIAFVNVAHHLDIEAARDHVIAGLKGLLGRARAEAICQGSKCKANELANLLHELQPSRSVRLLVVLNSLSLWTRRSGSPKNAVIAEFLRALFGGQSENIPVDFIVTCSDGRVPHIFTRAKRFRWREIQRPLLSEDNKRELCGRATLAGLSRSDDKRKIGHHAPSKGSSGADESAGAEAQTFHFLRPARASVVLPVFMTRVAAAFCAGALRNANLAELSNAAEPERFPKTEGVIEDLRQSKVDGGGPDGMEDHGKVVGAALIGALLDDLIDRTATIVVRDGTDRARLADCADREFKALFDVVERRRYALCLLAASADEERLTADASSMRERCEKVWLFLERKRRDLESIDPRDRERTLVKQCLEDYRARHQQGVEPPIEKAFLKGKDGGALFNMQHVILWHLASFGQPVSLQVLEQCPEVVKVAKALKAEAPRAIRAAMRLLLFRCLVLPFGRVSKGSAANLERLTFGVHRSMQLYMLRWLGAPAVEYQVVNQFTVTSYLNQPKDMPRLRKHAHHDLRRTIGALIQFPSSDPPHGRAVSRESAEAAVAMMRSVYSIASIARLGSLEGELFESMGDGGFFTEHARQARWLLLQDNLSEKPILTRDELVWALNECGVMNLIRGHLSDANLLLDMAERAAEPLESAETGPLRTRIFMNRALVMIEQGRGAAALQRLRSIEKNRRETRTIRLLGRGAIAWIDHLAGRKTQAALEYRRVVDELESRDTPRAASFFCRHFASLRMSEKDFQAADALLTRSVMLAEEGSHQDMLHAAFCGQAALWIKSESSDANAILSQLRTVEEYARRVGMLRLVMDAHLKRGELQLRSGDLGQAVLEFAEALRYAVTNRHKLRVVTALTLLAEAVLKTPARGSAEPLLGLANTLAQSAGYYTGLAAAQRLRMGNATSP